MSSVIDGWIYSKAIIDSGGSPTEKWPATMNVIRTCHTTVGARYVFRLALYVSSSIVRGLIAASR